MVTADVRIDTALAMVAVPASRDPASTTPIEKTMVLVVETIIDPLDDPVADPPLFVRLLRMVEVMIVFVSLLWLADLPPLRQDSHPPQSSIPLL